MRRAAGARRRQVARRRAPKQAARVNKRLEETDWPTSGRLGRFLRRRASTGPKCQWRGAEPNGGSGTGNKSFMSTASARGARPAVSAAQVHNGQRPADGAAQVDLASAGEAAGTGNCDGAPAACAPSSLWRPSTPSGRGAFK